MSVWAKWSTWAKWEKSSGGGSALPTDIPAAEAEALIWLYNNTDGDNWDDNTNWITGPLAANWAGITVSGGKVTVINLLSYWDNGLNGDIASWAIDAFTGLLELSLGGNALLTGDISGWSLPATIQQFNMYDTGISGDVSGIGIPSLVFAVDSTSAEGNFDGWAVPSTLAQFAIGATSCEGVPDFTNAEDIGVILVSSLGLSQVDVDLYLSRIYAIRNNLTGIYYDNDLDLFLSNNTTPSGIYQDGDPPTTGQEYVYELVNDPESEGFIPIDITYDESWAIQGTIVDDGAAPVAGVLVTLTGDASDTDTTDGSGNYTLSGLSNGDYTVTPTKAGETFTPTSSAVAIADGNETEDFEQDVFWQITGQILDADSAAVSGVLVTLSGDASDTDTTDGSGNYSFPGLPDGSYVVTPTNPTNREISPASSNETVSGGDETADFTQYFRHEKNWNGAGSVGASITMVYEGSAGSPEVVSWYNGEGENWNPTGFTDCFRCNIQTQDWLRMFEDVGEDIPGDRDLYFEVLYTFSIASGDPGRGDHAVELADDALVNGPYSDYLTWERNFLTATQTTEDGFLSTGGGSVALQTYTDTWLKLRGVVDVGANNIETWLIQASGPSTLGSNTHASSAAIIGRMFDGGVDNIVFIPNPSTAGTGFIYVARLWVGDAALGWPSDA